MITRWIVVTDTGRGKILEQKKDGTLVHVFPTLHPQEVDPHRHRDKSGHKPGIGTSSYMSSQHVFEPPTPWHEVEKSFFCKAIAQIINQHWEDFELLTLIAPPRVLGEMRYDLDIKVLKKIDQEIAKDLTKQPLAALKNYIGPPRLVKPDLKYG
jgi:protein required for attachment to host cells